MGFFSFKGPLMGFFFFKVTAHVGADSDFKIEIFAEYKYTLNELLVEKVFLNTSYSLRDMTKERFYRK